MVSLDTITTDRLLLEPWNERWRESWVALAMDRRVTRWIGNGEPWDRPRCEREFNWMLGHWRDHGFGWRSAIDKMSGDWLGFVGLNYVGANAVELDEGEVEIGWWLSPAVWGRGLATEGAFAVRDEGFESLGLDHIVSRHHASNPSSGRIMEKIGMHLERDASGDYGEPVRIYVLQRDQWLAFIK